MFRRENGEIYGVINDFDLAWMEDRVCKGHKSEWTGTRPFMAISLHLDKIQTHFRITLKDSILNRYYM